MKILYKSFLKEICHIPSIFFVILKNYQKLALRKKLTQLNRLLFFIKKLMTINNQEQPVKRFL